MKTQSVTVARGNAVTLLIRTMRPRQWVKNLFVFSPLLFSRHLFDTSILALSLVGFALFSLTASTIYIINDIIDAETDRLHPVKRLRPLASGALSTVVAGTAAGVIGFTAVALSFAIHTRFGVVILAYLVMNIVYSLFLKRAVIIDVMTIAASFVLRIAAGAVIISVPMSEWLLICTSLLALFLGFSKRRHEITVLEEDAHIHRPVLLEYNTYFLDQMTSLVTASTLICYILYTVSPETVDKFGSKNLLLTVPFVLYGLFRYLYLVHKRNTGGDPTAELLSDTPLILNIALWAASVVIIIYMR
ncbi:MAG: decaprenyl-phosphate phosphoribosyltransferase [Bacteroidia bacterium]|nr:decaprenyl-phosphate phosphoribosyltransferase [Bacteroidia bacterium]